MRKALFFVLFVAVTGLVTAQEQGPSPSEGGYSDARDTTEAPTGGPGVAHISLIHGDVSLQRGDSGDWVATSLNTPVVSGDAVGTSSGARAEVQLDYADVLRLAGQTQAKVASLDRNRIQVQMGQGLASLSMFQGGQADVEVDTPNVAIHPTKNGRYDIEVNSDSATNLVVREGEAEVSTPQGTTTVKEGELINIRGTDDPEYKVNPAPESDDWDRWNDDRDRLIRNAESVRHTNPYYTGTQDLDAYGHWQNIPNYGEVWAPNDQPATWAPYQAGRWVWEPYYGWTWASYEPWGWAPYHYGRWFFYDSSWYWWPGPVTPFYQPIWGPAFVSFIGFGPRVAFGFGFGTIGWCPLGPFEVFHPWWGFGFNRFGVVGVFGRPFGGRGFSTLNVAFTNARVRAGITTVRAENFGRGPAGFGHGVELAELRGAHLANGNLGIVPARESLAPTNRGFKSAPAGIRNTASNHFFSRSRTTVAAPSFREQTSRMQAAIRAHGGEGQFNARGQAGSDGRFSRNGGAANAGDRPGFRGFSNQGSSGRFGNEMRTDRPASRNQPFNGNQINNSGGNRDGFHGFSGNMSRGGTFENRGRQPNFPQDRGGFRNDRPPSSLGGGSRPPLDLSKRIVVPRTGNYGGNTSGNNGYRSSAPRYNGYSVSNQSFGGSRNSGGAGGSSRGYSSGRGGYSGGHYSGGSSGGHSSGGHTNSGHTNSGHSGGHGGGGRR